MKKVNFIIPVSPQKQYAIRRWFWITFFLCVTCVIASMYLILPQLLLYRTLHKEVGLLREKTREYSSSVKKRDELKKEHELIRVRTKKIENYHEIAKNPLPYIAAIAQACGDSVMLESVRFNKKECEIITLCPTSEYANIFIKRLSASELFANVKLVSLHYEAQIKKFRCVVKSIVKKA
jgi:Tfp pilus assembly protein PilN